MHAIIVTLLLCNSLSLPKFNTTLAYKLAHMSMAAYSDSQQIKRWSCLSCPTDFYLQDIKIIRNTKKGIQAYAGYSASDHAIILSFRGSDNIQNLVTDLQFLYAKYDKCDQCSVHSGFYRQIIHIKKNMLRTLKKLFKLHNCNKIYLTGHSLGGAIATLAAAQIHEGMRQIRIGTLITFGSPRVGNGKFAKYIDNFVKSWRIVYNADVVVQLPPVDIFYRHYGFEVWYDRQMQRYKICKGDSKRCQRSLLPIELRQNDHSMKNYLKILSLQQKRKEQLIKANYKNQKLNRKNKQ